MRVRLLGPVDAMVEGSPRPVRGLLRKAVLAVLGLQAGEIVSTGRLVEVLWGDGAPPAAQNSLQSHVSYLRGVLGSRAAIVARRPGYLLDLPSEATDAAAAEGLIRRAGAAEDPADRASGLRQALELWRGRSLMDVADLPWLRDQAERLEHLRFTAELALTDARLALGEHAQLVPELERGAGQHPFDEHLHEQLMLALYRVGRQADALAAFRRLRDALGADLGIDPGTALRELEVAILRQDPALDGPPPAAVVTTGAAAGPVPAQLPPAVPRLAGRAGELDRLDALLDGPTGAGDAGATVAVVSGTPGVGKTSLAVWWARRVADRFPGGQLYVNLRGFDPDGSVLDPAVAVRSFLLALGLPPQRLPADLDALTDLYRSVLAGRRMLVLLDNARDAAQVRPLLPGSAGSFALVTSRDQLTPLVVAEGAHPLGLDLLTRDRSRELLAGRLGLARVGEEPDAVDDIVDRCAGLPLALAITAARAAITPTLPLARLAAELRDAADALDTLHGGDAATDLRAVFSWSYRALSAPAARLFRLSGLHPGPDLTVPAAASLAGVPPRQARGLLAELARANLLTEHRPGRYACHDLLRAYATELARDDGDDARPAVTRRLLDHLLHTGYAAALLVEPGRDPIELPPPAPGVTPEPVADARAALDWFAAELAVLFAALRQADRLGFDAHTWQLAWTLTTYLQRRGLWLGWADAQQAAIGAARRAGDRPALAWALRSFGVACSELGRHDEAREHYEQALALFEELDDLVGQADTHLNFAWVSQRQQRLTVAAEHAQRALRLFRAAGHEVGQARALNNVGWHHCLVGHHRQALTYCEQALELAQRLGDPDGQAWTWDSLGYIHHHLGHHRQAIACYRECLNLVRRLGDRYSEAESLDHLAGSQLAAGDGTAAGRTWQRALDILLELEHPEAEDLRAKLRRLADRDGELAG
jgi:DNA-binding SARP family transcriptional activator